MVEVHFGRTKGDSTTSKDITPQRETDTEKRVSRRLSHLLDVREAGADDNATTGSGSAQRKTNN
jgi:hypothetical protein